jgi:hypothetical protein
MKQDSVRNADMARQKEGREVRARCWAYIFACFATKKTAEQSGHDNGKIERVGAEKRAS